MALSHPISRLVLSVSVIWVCLALPLQAQEPEKASALKEAFALWQEGYVLHLYGEYEKAAGLFQQSIDVQPTPEGHTFLGWSLSYLGQTERAIDECKKAIKLDPNYGNPYNDIGVYLIELGRADEAITWLEQAISAKRYCCYQYPHFNLGRVQILKGQWAEAERSFERALSYDPDYLPARKALEIMKGQKGETL